MAIMAAVLGGLATGAAGALLGGGSKAKAEHTSKPRMTPEQMKLLEELAAGFLGNPDTKDVMGGTDPFTGQMAPGMSKLENTSLQALEEMALQRVGGEDSTLKAARGAVEGATDSSVDMDEFNKYFEGAVQDPTLRAFQEDVIPQITSRFSGNAAFGSDRRVAEQKAVGNLGKNLGSSRADMLFKTQQAAKDRALQAAGLAPAVSGANMQQLMQLLAAGGVPRQVEDTQLTRKYSEFVRQQESKRKSMEMALALLGLNPTENIATVTPGQPNFLTAAAPGIGAAFSQWALRPNTPAPANSFGGTTHRNF